MLKFSRAVVIIAALTIGQSAIAQTAASPDMAKRTGYTMGMAVNFIKYCKMEKGPEAMSFERVSKMLAAKFHDPYLMGMIEAAMETERMRNTYGEAKYCTLGPGAYGPNGMAYKNLLQ